MFGHIFFNFNFYNNVFEYANDDYFVEPIT